MVFDNNAPAQQGKATRVIRVVSPCARGEVYCPSLLPACGTASCAARSALAAAPTPSVFASLRFDSSFAGGLVSTDGGRLAFSLHMQCQQAPPVPLTFCQADATGCGVYWGGSVDATPAVELLLRLAVPAPGAPACSAGMLADSACLSGSHELIYQAYNGYSTVSDTASITVHVGAPAVAWAMAVHVTLPFRGALSAAAEAEVLENVGRTFEGTNALLLQASEAVRQMLQDCSALGAATAFEPGSAHVSVSLAATPSANFTYSSGDDITSAEVCQTLDVDLRCLHQLWSSVRQQRPCITRKGIAVDECASL